MLKLVIDVGNTLTKIALFNNDKLIEMLFLKKGVEDAVDKIIADYGTVHSCIISSVKTEVELLEKTIAKAGVPKVITVRSGLLLPVKVLYKTPATLGSDRLANVCGATIVFPDSNILVIDIGTCIKYDIVTADKAYLGGSISPGLNIRYKSLSTFTAKLPYLKPDSDFPLLTGQSTEGSMRSGVEQGILKEIDGIAEQYSLEYNPLKIILTGGDHTRFADKLKSPIFVAPNLTINGLKVILDYNDH